MAILSISVFSMNEGDTKQQIFPNGVGTVDRPDEWKNQTKPFTINIGKTKY